MKNHNLEAQIKMYEDKIQTLKNIKIEQEKKSKAIKKLEKNIQEQCKENSIDIENLYLAQADAIEKWIKKLSKEAPEEKIISNLYKYFKKAPVANKSKKALPDTPKLAVGVYQNPHSKEKIEKIKRNPKALENWLEEYGFDTVQNWKI